MKLTYTRAELTDHHAYAEPHIVHGNRLHGGFDAQGEYVPPRSKSRAEAIGNWTASLEARGGALFEADNSLLRGPRMPNPAQQTLLLERGISQPFWNNLTVTGKLEARGRLLADVQFPSLAELIVEDTREMAVGHLDEGMLWAHGIDEGGQPDEGIGGHDVMWFVARDLVIDPGTHADVEPPENIGRPEAGQRLMPELQPQYEGLLSLLMNLLIIEFRAEIFFATAQEILRNPVLFTDRRQAAEEAAEIIERIRTDEQIHVESLRLYLGELREVTFRTVDGGTVPARQVIDRFWAGLAGWASDEQPKLAAAQQRALLEPLIEAQGGAALLAEFNTLADPH